MRRRRFLRCGGDTILCPSGIILSPYQTFKLVYLLVEELTDCRLSDRLTERIRIIIYNITMEESISKKEVYVDPSFVFQIVAAEHRVICNCSKKVLCGSTK